MLIFELDQNAGRVRVNPEAVDGVAETERRGRGGEVLVAEIVLRNGARYVVVDPERKAAEQIAEAARQQQAGRLAAQERVAKALELLGLQGD